MGGIGCMAAAFCAALAIAFTAVSQGRYARCSHACLSCCRGVRGKLRREGGLSPDPKGKIKA